MVTSVEILTSSVTAALNSIMTKEARPFTRLEAPRHSSIVASSVITSPSVVVACTTSGTFATADPRKVLYTKSVPEIATTPYVEKTGVVTGPIGMTPPTTISSAHLTTRFYATIVINGPLVHKSLRIILGQTAVANTTPFVLGLKTSVTCHGQTKTRRRPSEKGLQISGTGRATPTTSVGPSTTTISRPIYAAITALNDKVIFVQVDATDILVGQPTSTVEDATVTVEMATITAKSRPNSQDLGGRATIPPEKDE